MSITLYVDQISPDGSIAMTSNEMSIKHNLEKLKRPQSPIYSAGKYVCLHMSRPEGGINVFFLDFRANPDRIKIFIEASGVNEEAVNKLTKFFELVNTDYEELEDAVILKIGESPIPDLGPEYLN